MKLENGKITILISEEGTTIELHDRNASITFARITLTPKGLSAALSRRAYVDCDMQLHALDKIGKEHECKGFSFEIPEALYNDYKARDKNATHQIALRALEDAGMSDWTPDSYYGGQDSFYTKDGKHYAKAIIRRWVNKEVKTDNPL